TMDRARYRYSRSSVGCTVGRNARLATSPSSTARSLMRMSCSKAYVSQASRSPSLDPKWWRSSPGDTPASRAMSRTVAPSMPRSVNSRSAASRIRARAVRSSNAGWAMRFSYTRVRPTIRAYMDRRQMYRRGLVSFTSGEDARERIVALTAEGRALLPAIQAEWTATRAAVRTLDAELPCRLHDLVAALQEALDRRPLRARIADAAADLDPPYR